MERHAILELMVKLKLRGMRAAFDEVMAAAVKRHHSPERIVGELLAAHHGLSTPTGFSPNLPVEISPGLGGDQPLI